MQVAVIGLGKIGLPLAVQFAGKGHRVVGVDINVDTVRTVNAGLEPFPGEAHLQARLSEVVTGGSLSASTDFGRAVPGADVIVVVVPLFVDSEGQPDFGSLDSATEDISRNLSPRTLVIYETTLPVGTTRTRWKPALEKGSGLTSGEDFHLVFSPERVLTGRVFADLSRYPKLVGGLTDAGAEAATHFYSTVLDFDARPDLGQGNGVWDLGSAEAAELAKLAETTYRDVNIGLANQFARFAETAGIDIYKVIEASNSQPYSHIHSPGIAVGGHCIPVYPRLYLFNDPLANVVSSARQANEDMPRHAVELLRDAYGDLTGARVVVLGVSYRGGVKEAAFSGVFPLVEQLIAEGAEAVVHDPLYDDQELADRGFRPFHLGDTADAAIVQTDHRTYRGFGQEDVPGARIVIDGRNILDEALWPDARVITIGRGGV